MKNLLISKLFSYEIVDFKNSNTLCKPTFQQLLYKNISDFATIQLDNL